MIWAGRLYQRYIFVSLSFSKSPGIVARIGRTVRSRRYRYFVSLLAIPLPRLAKRKVFELLLGYDIHPTASIGLSIVLADEVYLGPHARIGHFTVVQNLKTLVVNEGAGIGQWIWISAASDLLSTQSSSAAGVCVLGNNAIITSRHYIDCSGGFFLGSFSILAGVRSTVMPHQIDVTRSQQTISTVRIGKYCHIGSNVSILPSTNVADRSLIAMGSVIRGEISPSGYLWAGVPAIRKREVTGEWFERTVEASKLPLPHNDAKLGE
jgi:acetyltransferase-like isoleucine patch superfamily enzyme